MRSFLDFEPLARTVDDDLREAMAPYSSCFTVLSFCRNWSVGIIVMQSHGQTWWHSVQPMQRGRSIVQTWNASSCRGPGMTLMQSTGQTLMHASQPVHMSSSSRARVLGSFFLAIGR